MSQLCPARHTRPKCIPAVPHCIFFTARPAVPAASSSTSSPHALRLPLHLLHCTPCNIRCIVTAPAPPGSTNLPAGGGMSVLVASSCRWSSVSRPEKMPGPVGGEGEGRKTVTPCGLFFPQQEFVEARWPEGGEGGEGGKGERMSLYEGFPFSIMVRREC